MKKPSIRYEDAVVSYTDIMGFKDLIESLSAARISRILGRFKRASRLQTFDVPVRRSRHDAFLSFSDLTVQALPLRKKKRDVSGAISGHILHLARVQCELIWAEGVFLRGGIAVGPVVKSYGLLYGNGLIRAYESEQKALWPIIAVDESVINECEKNPRLSNVAQGDELDEVMRCLKRDEERDPWFIDYLGVAQGEMEGGQFKALLKKHRKLVLQGLSKYSGIPDVSSKYCWLRAYHNAACQNLPWNEESGSYLTELIK